MSSLSPALSLSLQLIGLLVPIAKLDDSVCGGWVRRLIGVKTQLVLRQTAPLFVASNLLNICWIVFFTINTVWSIVISTVLIFGLLAVLLVIYVHNKAWLAVHTERDSFLEVLVIDVLFALYAGWVTVACIVSGAVLGVTLGWEGEPWTGTGWAILMLIIAAIVEIAVIVTRRDPVFPAVFCWATAAIATGHVDDLPVLITAAICSGVFGLTAIVLLVMHLVNAYRVRGGKGCGRRGDGSGFDTLLGS